MSRRAVRLAAVIATLGVVVPAHAAASQSGITPAQLRQLRALGMPVIVGPGTPPSGFRVKRVTPDSYDSRYEIEYVNASGGSIVFEVEKLRGGTAGPDAPAGASGHAPAGSAGYTEGVSTPSPKRGLLQKLFGAKPRVDAATVNANAERGSGSSSEAEGQTAGGILGSSPLLGPIRLVPSGACLRGTNESAKARGPERRLRVRLRACNVQDVDLVLSLYKRVQELH